MEIAVQNKDGIGEIALRGSVDTRSAQDLEAKFNELRESGTSRFVVDLENVDLLTSAGLRVFLALTNQLEGSGALALCRPNELVQQIFEVSRLEQFLNICASREEAYAKVREQASEPAAAPKPAVSPVTRLARKLLGLGGEAETAGTGKRGQLADFVAGVLSGPNDGKG